MAKIAFSLAGEGRGHATRAKTIVDHLIKRQHQVVLFAPEFAFRFLSDVYRDEHRVTVEEIPGLMFHYSQKRLHFLKTSLAASRYLVKLPQLITQLTRRLQDLRPDLAITDFEPALPRAATRAEIPWISVDHQHFLVYSDLSVLPYELQMKAWGMSQVVQLYHQQPAKSVVSSFYFPPLKSNAKNVVQTGVLLRDQVVLAQPEQQGHLLVYLRRFADRRVFEALSQCRCEVRIYGLGQQPDEGNLRFRSVSESGFLDDLRTCRALISNAGNQLVGEALFLRKPVFVFPEERNFEQEINARFLVACGGGDWCHLGELQQDRLVRFLDACDQKQCSIPRHRLNGNNATLQIIESMLPEQTLVPNPIKSKLVSA